MHQPIMLIGSYTSLPIHLPSTFLPPYPHSPTPHTHNITLILPAPGPAHIKEGLTLLATALREQEPQAHDEDQDGRLGLASAPWPFNPQPVFYNGTADSGVLAVGRLWQLDWRPRDDERGLAMRYPHTRVRKGFGARV